MTHGPNLACLFLNGSRIKSGFYIFKWLKEKSIEEYFITGVSYMKFKVQCP